MRKVGIYLLVFIGFIVVLYIIGGGYGVKTNGSNHVSQKDDLLFFAHRGITYNAPENTEQAFNKAKTSGFKAIETDLQLTADNKLVVFHDEWTNKLLDSNILISESTVEELQKHPIIYHNKKTNNHIIEFGEFLDEYGNDFIIYVDVKRGSKNRILKAKLIVDQIKSRNLEDRIIVASGDFLFIAYNEYFHPEIQTVLEGFTPGKEWLYPIIPKNLKPDYYSSFADRLNTEHIEWLMKNNLLDKRIVYGVDQNNLNKTLQFGIRNIIIDYKPGMDLGLK